MDNEADVVIALRGVKRLSEEDITRHAKYLRQEDYPDVGSLREACMQKGSDASNIHNEEAQVRAHVCVTQFDNEYAALDARIFR